jgi:hypothetical protein
MSSSQAASALLPGARCASHDRPATGLCSRCGDYLCGACGRRVGARLCCGACAGRLREEHSGRSVLAAVLGMLGVLGLLFLSPVALVVASAELRAIRAGQAPLGGLGLARAGLIFGGCGLAMAASAVAVWLATHRG